MVTIDGEDARDLDDAVSLEEKDGRWLLGVHIADVADYVQENSALDWEAKERGTSVYLPDRVIPMLPKELSNGCCSLNAGEDRLALSCLMEVDKGGTIGNYEIVESVIHVDKRMSYTQVQKILDGDEALWEAYCDEAPMLTEMAKLSKVLRQKRKERGAVDFDFPESKIELDENGEPLSIHPHERNDATKLIEDFMLAANETVAQHFYWLEEPFYTAYTITRIRKKCAVVRIFRKFRLSTAYRAQTGKTSGKRGRRPSEAAAKASGSDRRDAGGSDAVETDSAQHEARGLFAGLQRTFWTGSNTLLSFYVPNQAISRFADSPDYQGVSAGTVKRKAKELTRTF